jgi:hypothetical protein
MSFDAQQFLDALEAGKLKAALYLATRRAGLTPGRLRRECGRLTLDVLDAAGGVVGSVRLDVSARPGLAAPDAPDVHTETRTEKGADGLVRVLTVCVVRVPAGANLRDYVALATPPVAPGFVREDLRVIEQLCAPTLKVIAVDRALS